VGTQHSDFGDRHIGPSDGDVAAMLSALGIDSLESLLDRVVPSHIRDPEALGLPALGEADALERLRSIAAQNRVRTALIG